MRKALKFADKEPTPEASPEFDDTTPVLGDTMGHKAFPKFLYHGTRSGYLPSIRNQGLVPRQLSGNSQWEHSVASRPDAVYLTSAYPLHFAANANGEGDFIIFEIATANLLFNMLIADEDAIALSEPEPHVLAPSIASQTERTKAHSHHYSASYSLHALGTCAYLGTVLPACLTRAAIITEADIVNLILSGFDPVIRPLNYELFGREYEQSVPWLFGDVTHCALNPNLKRPNIQVLTF